MNNKVTNQDFHFDGLKWGAILIIIFGAVAANYYLTEFALYYRVLGVVAGLLICFLLAARTSKGHKSWLFLQEARAELRRVVWPTRPETIQSTLVVLGMVFVMSLLLWVIDAILFRVMTMITGG